MSHGRVGRAQRCAKGGIHHVGPIEGLDDDIKDGLHHPTALSEVHEEVVRNRLRAIFHVRHYHHLRMRATWTHAVKVEGVVVGEKSHLGSIAPRQIIEARPDRFDGIANSAWPPAYWLYSMSPPKKKKKKN